MFAMKRVAVVALVGFAGAVIVAGCDDGVARSGAPDASASAGADALPAGLIVAEAPASAKGVGEVREAAADGDDVVLRGRVAGSADPFTPGRAVFQLVDSGIKSCAETEGDGCATPWDMCCEDPSTLLRNSVTVQVVGPDGRPLKAGLKDVAGLKPLSEVSVKGKLRKSADGKAVTVDATELHVKQG